MDCPRCGVEAPDGARFCRACGLTLGEAPAETPAADARAPAPAGERRQATIPFSDLSGFTALNERLDAEDVREVMAQVFGGAERVIGGYGGSVEKYIGDAIMAALQEEAETLDDPAPPGPRRWSTAPCCTQTAGLQIIEETARQSLASGSAYAHELAEFVRGLV